MAGIKIIRSSEVVPAPLPGTEGEKAGWIKRIVYPPQVVTKGSFLGAAEFNPGYSVHRWHTHTRDKAEGYEVDYPENFEEIYYIISGRGVMQWKTPDGKIEEEKVGPGDTMFMPVGVVEHQLLNNGQEKMVIVFCGYPTPKVTFKNRSL